MQKETTTDTNRITCHSLFIKDVSSSLNFYQEKLGMTLTGQTSDRDKVSSFLGYRDGSQECLLELIFDPAHNLLINKQNSGYWKIAISVDDLDIARQSLIDNQVKVSEAFEVPDVAYLCHLEDPDGYCIELIQTEFPRNHQPGKPDLGCPLNTPAHFSLITYRITNPEARLEFYENVLGMRLLSRQILQERGFTLYFLGYSDEALPIDDIDAIGNREWLWQRPYTLVELQHVWRGDTARVAYDTSRKTGFECISIKAGRAGECESTELADPDGYRIRLVFE